MTITLTVIWLLDDSGSISQLGRDEAQIYVLSRAIHIMESLFYSTGVNINNQVVCFSNTVRWIDSISTEKIDSELLELKRSGPSNVGHALIIIKDKIITLNLNSFVRIILISDGYFTDDFSLELIELNKNLNDVSEKYCITVGYDINYNACLEFVDNDPKNILDANDIELIFHKLISEIEFQQQDGNNG